MKSILANKNVLLIVALIIVVGVGFYMFTSPKSDSALTTTTGGMAGTPVVGQELVIELNRLKALKTVDTGFLSDPTFVSLQDFTEPVPPQPLGRANPFAPVGDDF